MSWHYSQALVAVFLGEKSLDGNVFAPSKSRNTHGKSSCPDKTTVTLTPSLYGTMLGRLRGPRGVAWWISLLAAFHAKTYQPQVKALESTECKADCGKRQQGSFAKWDQSICSWKTHQYSLLGDLESFSETWPRWGMMQDGECWELSMPALPIKGIESGSLATPSGTSNHGKNHVCGRLDEWGPGSNPFRGKPLGKVSCPSFEEYLLGWPIGWTELTPLETAKFRQWLRSHGISSNHNEP
jgi:hypothetical protein